MCHQSPASRRLRPINAAKETTNRTAACVNVGVVTGEKSGAATSVCGTVNTFNKFSWYWKIGARGDQSCRSAAAHLSDLRADVCSRQDTRLALMRLIVGGVVPVSVQRRVPGPGADRSGSADLCPAHPWPHQRVGLMLLFGAARACRSSAHR